MLWPVSVKAVILDDHGRALLGRNDREEWELLGGRLDAGESPEEAVVREVDEEAGLEIAPVTLLRSWVFSPLPGTAVLIISYGCLLRPGRVRLSDEHEAVAFHTPEQLGRIALPSGYRTDIELWRERR